MKRATQLKIKSTRPWPISNKEESPWQEGQAQAENELRKIREELVQQEVEKPAAEERNKSWASVGVMKRSCPIKSEMERLEHRFLLL